MSHDLIVNMFRDSPWPGNILSNFADTPFEVDGVHCACSESFIQSLKIAKASEQAMFCSLKGEDAWKNGSRLTASVFSSGKVWWQGVSYDLHSKEHFEIVKRGLIAKYSQSKDAREALLASGNATLTHDYGQPPGEMQSLPIAVFCQIVTKIRQELKSE